MKQLCHLPLWCPEGLSELGLVTSPGLHSYGWVIHGHRLAVGEPGLLEHSAQPPSLSVLPGRWLPSSMPARVMLGWSVMVARLDDHVFPRTRKGVLQSHIIWCGWQRVCGICPHLSVDMNPMCAWWYSHCWAVIDLFFFFFLMLRESSGRGSAVFCLLLHRTAMWSVSGELGCFKTGSGHCFSLFCLGLFQRQKTFMKKKCLPVCLYVLGMDIRGSMKKSYALTVSKWLNNFFALTNILSKIKGQVWSIYSVDKGWSFICKQFL